MQTISGQSCQSAPPRAKKSIRLKTSRHCECCGKEYHPSHGKQIVCSLSCSGRLNNHRRTGLFHREKCAACHAIVGMSGTMSGELVGWDKSLVSVFRKKNGLKTWTASQSGRFGNKSAEKELTKWMVDAFNGEWQGVVDNYWTRCTQVVIARMCDPEMRGRSNQMVSYYLTINESRKRAALNANNRHHSLKNNSDYKVKTKLRNHIARVCRRSKTGKTRRTIDYLGCDINHARRHIQKQFKRGMEWDNHGIVWEIDHIVPMSHFDLQREDQRLIVNHFTNLRPEFKQYNREKGDRMIGQHQLCMI